MSGRRGKRGGGGGGHEGGDERWLLTYADMITLLLALFIVLFAMSTIDAKQFENVSRSLSQTFKGDVLTEPGQVLSGSDGVLDPQNASQRTDKTIDQVVESSNATAKAFKQEQAKLQKIIKASGLKQDVQITPSQRGFTISIAGDALFDSGSARLRPEMERKLTKISKELISFRRSIAIEGHTDSQPINGAGGWANNWDLSCGRSGSVLQLFLHEGMPAAKVHQECYGSSQPKVKPPSSLASVRANRRIEIVVLAPGADDAGLPANRAEQLALDRQLAAARHSTPNGDPASQSLGSVILSSTTLKPNIKPVTNVNTGPSAVTPITNVASGG